MNTYQQTLYADLMNLCQNSDAFYYADQAWHDQMFRIFSYRLASYTEFQQRNAIECRGHSFRIDAAGNALELVSLPMQKFWNDGENPNTMDLDYSKHNIDSIMDKLDGSLISTVKTLSGMRLKSKTSLNSVQAKDACELLNTEDYTALRQYCSNMSSLGYTVNMEYCAPTNVIVIMHTEPSLRVLNVRRHSDGQYVSRKDILKMVPTQFVVQALDIPDDSVQFVKSIADMTGIEGYIIVLKNGLFVKHKTVQYVNMHHIVSNLNSPKRLYELIVTETTDDVIPLIKENTYLMNMLEVSTKNIRHVMVNMMNTVDTFYEQNKALDRKSFAILGLDQLSRHEFNLAMMKYVGKSIDYKEFMVKNYDLFKSHMSVSESVVEE